MRINAVATNRDAFRRSFFWYLSARRGFGAFLDATAQATAGEILLPAFVGWSHREGSGVLDPITERGLPHTFYRMDPGLRIDLSHLEELLRSRRVRLLVIIHFFGYVDPGYRDAVDLAREWGAMVLEDEAHALYTDLVGGQSGRLGDAAIYSLHKMLPVPVGGMLVVNPNCRGSLEATPSGLPESDVQWDFDLNRIAQRRIDNALELSGLIGPLSGEIDLLWPPPDPGVVPQTLPILVRTVSRDLLYRHMNEEVGGVVTLYHTLVDGIASRAYPDSHRLSQQIMNLPVHQDMGSEEVQALASQLALSVETLGNRGSDGR